LLEHWVAAIGMFVININEQVEAVAKGDQTQLNLPFSLNSPEQEARVNGHPLNKLFIGTMVYLPIDGLVTEPI